MNKFDFNIEQLFKFDYGGTPKFDRMQNWYQTSNFK